MQDTDQIGIVLELAGDDLCPGNLIRAVGIKLVQVLPDVLDQNGLR